MNEAYSTSLGRKLYAYDAKYYHYHGVLKCPECDGIVHLKKEYTTKTNKLMPATFVHDKKADSNCPNRVSWGTSRTIKFHFSGGSSRGQEITILGNNFVRAIKLFYNQNSHDIRVSKLRTSTQNYRIEHPTNSQDYQSLICKLVASKNGIQSLANNKIQYFENKLMNDRDSLLRFKEFILYPDEKTIEKYGINNISLEFILKEQIRAFEQILPVFLNMPREVRNNIAITLFDRQNLYFTPPQNSLLNQNNLDHFFTNYDEGKVLDSEKKFIDSIVSTLVETLGYIDWIDLLYDWQEAAKIKNKEN